MRNTCFRYSTTKLICLLMLIIVPKQIMANSYELITPGTGYQGTLQQLKSRQGRFSWSPWAANYDFSGYEFFLDGNEADNWNDNYTEHMFAMIIWEPPVENVENIVFIAAGQQGLENIREAYPNIATGQKNNWHSNQGILNKWQRMPSKYNVPIVDNSIAGQIVADAELNNSGYFGFDSSNTFMALIFDSRVNNELSVTRKHGATENFIKWLGSRTTHWKNGAKGKTVYLAGTSRGGALAVHMAYAMQKSPLFTSKYQAANIIVASLDGVFNYKQDEMYNTDVKVSNPRSSSDHCYLTDFPYYFNQRTNINLLQIAGGKPVNGIVAVKQRCFAFSNYHSLNSSYKHHWVTRSHKEIGREYHDDTVGEQLRFLNQHTGIRNKTYEPPRGAIQFRHKSSGSFIYSSGADTGPVGHDNDPNSISHHKKYWRLQGVGNNQFVIKSEFDGSYLYATNTNGSKLRHRAGAIDPSLYFTKQSASNGFRLKHQQTGNCLYNHSDGFVRVWPCWNSENMIYQSNKALWSNVSVKTTYPGYSISNIIDGSNSTSLGGSNSWVNNKGSTLAEREITLEWDHDLYFSKVNIYTTIGYELQEYEILFHDGITWQSLYHLKNNTLATKRHVFPSIYKTRKLMIRPLRGSVRQPGYARINEIEVF